ncbi:glycosyltransferase family 9 protein [Escherichia coli]
MSLPNSCVNGSCAAVSGVDSAPAHIAAAVNTPLISLFGATDHIFWRPWSNNMIQFWADPREMPTRDQRDRNADVSFGYSGGRCHCCCR